MKHASQSLAILVLVLVTPALLAQISTGGMGVAGGASMGGATAHGAFGTGHGFGHPARPGIVGGFHHRGFHNNRFFSPFWSSAFWWDDGYPDRGDQVVVQPPAAPVVVQAAPQPVQELKPANPLLIELQGDRFVRLTGNEADGLVAARGAPSQQHAELPPAVLVFRDGHRQEISSYAIIGQALYASGSYWTNGYWNQKILLADLDLPATLRANQERGVNFVLPASPDQVVTRP